MSNHGIRIISGVLAGTIFALFFCYAPTLFSTILVGGALLMLILEIPPLTPLTGSISSVALRGFVLLYVSFAVGSLLYLNHTSSRMLLVYLFIGVFTHDSGALYVGSLFGSHKLAPSISPNKTWEGLVGGYVATIGAITILLYCFTERISPSTVIIVSLMISGAATSGDLFESWLKRKVDLKDSGTFLPGHGGVFDRADACIAAAIVFFTLQQALTPLLL